MEHAQHTARLENLYAHARAAEQSEGWSTAVDCYEQVMRVDPDYRDTVFRRDFCRDRQRIMDLQEVLRYHASDGRWQTVLDVSEELRQLDPAAADPDGLSTRAHQEVEHAQHTARLENLYAHARAAEQSEGWSTAVDCYEQVMQVDPDYRDTVFRRDFCRDRQRIMDLQEVLRYHASDGRWQTVLDVSEELRQLDPASADPDGLSTRAHREMEQEQTEQLETLYTHARAAELSEDWTAAIAYYGPLTDEGKEYKDSKQRRSLCLEHQEIIQSMSSGYDSSNPAKTLEIAAHCGALAWESTSLAVDIWDEPRIRIYDMLGVERLTIKTGKRWGPYVVAFSPDGNRLVSKGRKGAIIWDANTGEKLLHVPVGIEVAAAAFSPDGTCLATGSDTCTYIWDIDTVEKIFWSEQRLVKAVAFSPDGSRLVVADSGGLKVWQPNTALRIFEDHRRFLNAVAYSSDGKRVAAGGDDKKVHLWGSGQARELPHDAPVSTVAFSPNGALLATGSYDHTVRIWDATNADMICNIPHDEMVLSVAFSPYGTRLATGTPHAVTVWTFQ
ncbi:WD40 repeat domain-containing protein [Streptomyces syringium]|uniref:WD40 repeat domain-containing protein n=1 Tax=Streptomyces syringium TaxID=76729 RepID=UPI0034411A95